MSANETLRFFAAHPELRRRIAGSRVFPRIKRAALVKMDGEDFYIVKGDTLGSEEELFVEAIIRGAAGQGELNRELFAELGTRGRELILRTFKR